MIKAKNKSRWIALATDAKIFFFALLWLMVLLLVGTIAQKYVGLYVAQNQYFSCFVAWFGFVPLPGGYVVMTIIFFNLLAKILFDSPWQKKHVGNIISHLGALLLLLGGFLTAAFSYEGSMLIAEGGNANFISDYHERELVVIDNKSGQVVEVFYNEDFVAGNELQLRSLPVSLAIQHYYRNSRALKHLGDDGSKVAKLEAVPLELEDEANASGMELVFSNDKMNSLFVYEAMVSEPLISILDKKYRVGLRRKRTYLPFRVELVDFEKQVHPATNTPRSYKSLVRLHDGDISWETEISMNQPLRYKGYTLYQASFMSGSDGSEATVLAVVKNVGRLFPYISSTVMCVGLLIHLFIRMPKLFRRSQY